MLALPDVSCWLSLAPLALVGLSDRPLRRQLLHQRMCFSDVKIPSRTAAGPNDPWTSIIAAIGRHGSLFLARALATAR